MINAGSGYVAAWRFELIALLGQIRQARQTAAVDIRQTITADQTIHVTIDPGPTSTQAELKAVQSKVQRAIENQTFG